MIKEYTVLSVCGDYAIIIDSLGNEISISVFLLPNDIMEGDILISDAPMQYEKKSL